MSKISKFLVLLVVGAVALFSSCKMEGGYDINNFVVTYGEIRGTDLNYTILTDKGNTLFVIDNNYPGFEVVDGQRVMVNYTILEEKLDGFGVRINGLSKLLCKNPVHTSSITEEALKDSIGVDPIDIVDVWFSAGKYLNVNFEIYRRSTTLAHFINLVVDDQASTDEQVVVELRHNAYGDLPKVSTLGRVSFNIADLIPEGKDEIKVVLKWTDYYGQAQSDEGVFKRRELEPAPILGKRDINSHESSSQALIN